MISIPFHSLDLNGSVEFMLFIDEIEYNKVHNSYEYLYSASK